MNKIFIFGIGGAGNKVLATAIREGVISKDNSLLVNTTKKDIPADLDNVMYIADADSEYGCAKNREASKQLLIKFLKTKAQDIDEAIPEDIEQVVIVNSTEGGTGSGAAPLLARYIEEELNLPVINIPIFGFNDDVSGMKNSLSYLTDIPEHIGILPISNSKKNDIEDINNFFRIEQYVNDIIIEKIKVIMGYGIIDSDQNIDAEDHLSLTTNPGMMFVDTISLAKVKDTKQFNDAIMSAITNSISFDVDSSLVSSNVMLGIFLNVSDTKLDYIGTDFTSLKKRLFGEYAPKTFFHRQYDGKEEYVRIVITGLNIPITEAKDLKNRIETEISKVSNSASSNFFDEIKNISVNEDTPSRSRRSKGGFLDTISTDVDEETSEVINRRGNGRKRNSTPSVTSNSQATSADVQAPKGLSIGGKNMTAGQDVLIKQ